jgi:hypothetical protein
MVHHNLYRRWKVFLRRFGAGAFVAALALLGVVVLPGSGAAQAAAGVLPVTVVAYPADGAVKELNADALAKLAGDLGSAPTDTLHILRISRKITFAGDVKWEHIAPIADRLAAGPRDGGGGFAVLLDPGGAEPANEASAGAALLVLAHTRVADTVTRDAAVRTARASFNAPWCGPGACRPRLEQGIGAIERNPASVSADLGAFLLTRGGQVLLTSNGSLKPRASVTRAPTAPPQTGSPAGAGDGSGGGIGDFAVALAAIVGVLVVLLALVLVLQNRNRRAAPVASGGPDVGASVRSSVTTPGALGGSHGGRSSGGSHRGSSRDRGRTGGGDTVPPPPAGAIPSPSPGSSSGPPAGWTPGRRAPDGRGGRGAVSGFRGPADMNTFRVHSVLEPDGYVEAGGVLLHVHWEGPGAAPRLGEAVVIEERADGRYRAVRPG